MCQLSRIKQINMQATEELLPNMAQLIQKQLFDSNGND
ncbi:hypothetical protein EGR_08979 [Echinococcus granulosus]|uniref:Uncharacterized protein n=1 Tax=Echinococcus granulosus TaxID=6210 RepID=W6URX8_ECHGR|nr:hypothetical protein EGR_08979 [Echinococcus granulosus]EUB56174.1 hypothetical protein EGR_08979 [Echinococcus granulosus]